MYKDKKKQRKANRDSMRKLRAKQGITEGITPFIPYHIVEKLADKEWREKITMLKIAFADSHNPYYASSVCFCECGTDLSQVFDWLEVTG